MHNWFVELSKVDVNDHVKQKNGLSFLSWMWAYMELKKRYPLSYTTVHETEDGMLVWKDPVGCHVKTSVTIVWEEADGLKEHTVTEYLPVMDFKNKAVPYENVDSMMVNKAIQRSLTKCIARLGLGGYIYVSEDLPEEVKEAEKLVSECYAYINERSKLSKEAAQKVAEACKETLPSECNGDPNLCNDVATLKLLKTKLLGIRK